MLEKVFFAALTKGRPGSPLKDIKLIPAGKKGERKWCRIVHERFSIEPIVRSSFPASFQKLLMTNKSQLPQTLHIRGYIHRFPQRSLGQRSHPSPSSPDRFHDFHPIDGLQVRFIRRTKSHQTPTLEKSKRQPHPKDNIHLHIRSSSSPRSSSPRPSSSPSAS